MITLQILISLFMIFNCINMVNMLKYIIIGHVSVNVPVNLDFFPLKKITIYSLDQDLGLLINNPKYGDIEILCGDEETVVEQF